jgi:prephenate dehydrogenase
VASVKAAPEAWAREAGLATRYVGLHPMAGVAQGGFAFSTAEMYVGVPWIVVPNPQAEACVRDVVAFLCDQTRARVLVTDADRHDASAALVSHIPHVLANALLCEVGESELARLAFAMSAGSFRDMTRVAGTEPARTRNMLVWNRTQVVSGLADLVARLQELSRELSEGDESLPSLLAAHRIRDGLEAAVPPARLVVGQREVIDRLLALASEGRPVIALHAEPEGWVIDVE